MAELPAGIVLTEGRHLLFAGGCQGPGRPSWRPTGRCSTSAGLGHSGPLSAKLVQNGPLKTRKGVPHGMPTTEAKTINADLLAFMQSCAAGGGRGPAVAAGG